MKLFSSILQAAKTLFLFYSSLRRNRFETKQKFARARSTKHNNSMVIGNIYIFLWCCYCCCWASYVHQYPLPHLYFNVFFVNAACIFGENTFLVHIFGSRFDSIYFVFMPWLNRHLESIHVQRIQIFSLFIYCSVKIDYFAWNEQHHEEFPRQLNSD